MAIKRQQIVDAIVDRLETILTSGGYHTDLGSNVFEWKSTKFEDRELPGIDVRDTSQEIDQRGLAGPVSVDTHILTVMLSLVVSGSTSTTTVRQMLSDVYAAIGMDTTWGGLAIDTWTIRDQFTTEQEELRLSGVDIELAIQYRTDRFQEE